MLGRGASCSPALASLALPGTNSFVSEFLVLIGSFPREPVFTIIATVGIILAALYMLLMYQRTMQGPVRGRAVAATPSSRRRRAGAGPGAMIDPAIAARRAALGLPGPVRPRDRGAGAADRR